MLTVFVLKPSSEFVAKFKTQNLERLKKDLQEKRVQLDLKTNYQVQVGKQIWTLEITDKEIILHSGSHEELKKRSKEQKLLETRFHHHLSHAHMNLLAS